MAQLFEPLEIVLESSVIIYRSLLHFQRTGDNQISYKVVVFFPFLTYTQMMFSTPYKSLFNVLHERPFHDHCQFFGVTFIFTFIFITELFETKKSELALWISEYCHMLLMILKNTACFRMFIIVISCWWKNNKTPEPNNLSNAAFLYSALFSLTLCFSPIKRKFSLAVIWR